MFITRAISKYVCNLGHFENKLVQWAWCGIIVQFLLNFCKITYPPHTYPSNSTVAKDTPVTQVQNFLKATSLNDISLLAEESLLCSDGETTESSASQASQPAQLWKDIDQAESHDPLFSAEYAPEIYAYMRKREVNIV